MIYENAVKYILQFADFERSSKNRRDEDGFALDRITSLLDRMGTPQATRTTVHVAGSKGKGSTAAIIESILRAAGMRTGLFTSPHIDKFSERIRLGGQPLSESVFAGTVEAIKPIIEIELKARPGRLSVFEILTAMAFHAFQQANVDVQVVEVGLGGRLDSTNVFGEKAVAIITALSLEHTDVLGDDINQIALEKAGIINPATGVVVLAPQQSDSASQVVRDYAEEMRVPLIDVRERYDWALVEVEHNEGWSAQQFRLERKEINRGDVVEDLFSIPLLGFHQIENSVTALAAVNELRNQGMAISTVAIHQGMAKVAWRGRLEILSRDPLIVIDAAHNEESVSRVVKSLPYFFKYERLIVVIGTLQDKNIEGMALQLEDASTVVVTTPPHPRASKADVVAQLLRDRELFSDEVLLVEEDVGEAMSLALSCAGSRDLICVLGSLFVAAEARKHILSKVDCEPASVYSDR